MNIWFDYILFRARAQPETPAIILEDRVVTYAMLREGIASCAQRLAGMNFDRGGVVSVMVNNPIRHLVLCFALYRLGIVSLSLDHHQSGVRAIKVAAVLGDAEAQGLPDPTNRFIEVSDSWFAEAAAGGGSLPEVVWDSSQIYRHGLTSGSTGQPKVIMHTAEDIAERIRTYSELNWNRALCLFGLSSNFGFTAACAVLATGRTLCFAPSPTQAVRMIELFSVDLVFASTEQMLTLTRAARRLRTRLNSLRILRVAGSVPSRALLESAMIHLCRNIICAYGASEAGAIAQAPAGEVISNPGLVGYVLPGVEVGIFDPDGHPCPAGIVGSVRCRKKPDSTARQAGESRWIDLGDVGRLDPDGRLFIFGRTADLAGSQANYSPGVSPAYEIEHRVRLEWDLVDAASITVAAGAAGETPEIWIGLVQGTDITAEKVNALALANKIDWPVRLFELHEIPRGSNGKVDRPRLKALMLASSSTAAKAPWN